MKKVILTVLMTVSFLAGAHAQNGYGYGYGTTNHSRTYSNTTYGTTNNSVRYQQGYTQSNGTYVSGHYKTNSNSTNYDNFSTKGNYNPYTGSYGTRARDYSPNAYNYGAGQIIQSGPRGGQYYMNSRGHKVSVPKRW